MGDAYTDLYKKDKQKCKKCSKIVRLFSTYYCINCYEKILNEGDKEKNER
jgi:hypothetical protein